MTYMEAKDPYTIVDKICIHLFRCFSGEGVYKFLTDFSVVHDPEIMRTHSLVHLAQ